MDWSAVFDALVVTLPAFACGVALGRLIERSK